MQPFDHQIEAVEATLPAIVERRKALVIMATGLGKTFVAAKVYQKLKRQKGSPRNLVLCHDNDILEQSEPTFRAVLGEYTEIGYFNGETKDGKDSQIVFSTFQTLQRCMKEVFSPDDFHLVTVDEAHHAPAETFREVIEYFSGASRLGLTAIRERMDGQDISEIFGDPVVYLPLEEAIARSLLTPFEYRVVSDGLSVEAIQEIIGGITEGKRYTLSDVNKLLFIEARDEEIVKRVKDRAGTSKTLVFCRNIEHANRIVGFLGESAKPYHSGESKGTNRKTLTAFRKGTVRTLVAVNKANEGVDIPDAEVVVFLRTTESKTVLFQQLGRALRKLPGKKKALILDFVGNLRRIEMLKDLVHAISKHQPPSKHQEVEHLSVSGDGFEFNFSEEIIEVAHLISRLKRDFYKTWQEASIAAQRLGFARQVDYVRSYRKDPGLPAQPASIYVDFPGWAVFLKKKYLTWEEASEAAIELGISTSTEYKKLYRGDKKLPSDPDDLYPDFPGWIEFFGRKRKNHYPTWQEASAGAGRLKVSLKKDYLKNYMRDERLPSHPELMYKDFPGWKKFLPPLAKPPINPATQIYRTWQEARRAARKLGIHGLGEYRKMCHLDQRLPKNPEKRYKNFPGYTEFFGRKREHH